jgi:hypothetical protein
MVASVVSVKASNEKQIAVTLGEQEPLLDATIVGDPIASGPNAGKAKPILLGAVSNFDLTPYLLDTANLVYLFNHRAVNGYLPASPFPDYQIAGDVAGARQRRLALQDRRDRKPDRGGRDRYLQQGWPTASPSTTCCSIFRPRPSPRVSRRTSNTGSRVGPHRGQLQAEHDARRLADRHHGGFPVDGADPAGAPVLHRRRGRDVTLSSTPAGRATFDFLGHLPDVRAGRPAIRLHHQQALRRLPLRAEHVHEAHGGRSRRCDVRRAAGVDHGGATESRSGAFRSSSAPT